MWRIRGAPAAIVLLLGIAGYAAPSAAQTCVDDQTCGSERYCARPTGRCGGAGECAPRPEDGLCPAIVSPVCGCDHRTYPNACHAQVRGQSLAHLGSCCAGDCSGQNRVTVADLMLGIRQNLEIVPLGFCRSFDPNGDGRVGVDEIILAVNHLLYGCPTLP